MAEYTVVHCNKIQPHNSKWARVPVRWGCTICGEEVKIHEGIYGPRRPSIQGPKLPKGWHRPHDYLHWWGSH